MRDRKKRKRRREREQDISRRRSRLSNAFSGIALPSRSLGLAPDNPDSPQNVRQSLTPVDRGGAIVFHGCRELDLRSGQGRIIDSFSIPGNQLPDV